VKKFLLYIFITIQLNIVAQDNQLPYNHFFVRDSIVYSDSVIVSNVLSNDQTYYPKIYSSKNNLHRMNYSFEKSESNWISDNLLPLYNENNLSQIDSNVQMNLRYSFGLGVDHLFDINYRRRLTKNTLFFDFSRTASPANFNHSYLSGMNFRVGLLDTTGKFEHKVILVNNTWEINENGGIKNLDIIKDEPSLPNLNLFTNLNTAKNYIKTRIFVYENKYNFIQLNDSNSYKFYSITGVKYKSESYRFTMEKKDIDSLFFNNTFLSNNLTNDSVGNIVFSPYLGLGIQNKLFILRGVYKKDISFLKILEQERIEGELKYVTNKVLFSTFLDYRLSGIWANGLELKNKFKWKNKLDLVYNYSKILPNYFYLNYFGNHFYWDNNFKAQTDHVLKLKYNTKLDFLKFNLELYNFTNYVYLNENSIPSQFNNSLSLIKGQVHFSHHSKYFISENKITYQHKTNNILRVPNYFIESTQALNFKILKMPLCIGGSVVYFPKHAGLAYNPNLRNYYLQNNQLVGGFPMVDVFLAAKAGGAELFLKVQNLFYPILDGGEFLVYENMVTVPNFIRVGFNWKILD